MRLTVSCLVAKILVHNLKRILISQSHRHFGFRSGYMLEQMKDNDREKMALPNSLEWTPGVFTTSSFAKVFWGGIKSNIAN